MPDSFPSVCSKLPRQEVRREGAYVVQWKIEIGFQRAGTKGSRFSPSYRMIESPCTRQRAHLETRVFSYPIISGEKLPNFLDFVPTANRRANHRWKPWWPVSSGDGWRGIHFLQSSISVPLCVRNSTLRLRFVPGECISLSVFFSPHSIHFGSSVHRSGKIGAHKLISELVFFHPPQMTNFGIITWLFPHVRSIWPIQSYRS